MTRRGLSSGVSALVASALAAAVLAAGAAGAPSTTEPVQLVSFNVTLTASDLRLQYRGVPNFSLVQFRIRNRSGSSRTFAVGKHSVRVKANGYRNFLVYFGRRGTYKVVSRAGTSVHTRFLNVV